MFRNVQTQNASVVGAQGKDACAFNQSARNAQIADEGGVDSEAA